MPSIKENYNTWNTRYKWTSQGDEWSEPWVSAEHQWYTLLLPRIYHYLPAEHILEIAPGQGRWTQFLLPLARQLSIVDLSETCITHCRQRFAAFDHLRYFVNDGKSLEGIEDNSVDFVFSFDSLVHAEYDVMCAYLGEIQRVLRQGGTAVIHHSNLAASRHGMRSRALHWLLRRLRKLGLRWKNTLPHWRSASVSAELILEAANTVSLTCSGQEIFKWLGSRVMTDCISVFCKVDSGQGMPVRFENARFHEAIGLSQQVFACYKRQS